MKKKLILGMTVLFMIIAVIFAACPSDSGGGSAESSDYSEEDDDNGQDIISPNKNPEVLVEGDNIALTVSVGDDKDPAVEWQWYVNTENSNKGGKIIKGATTAEYNPPSTPGTFYYYVEVTLQSGKLVTSKPVKVVVAPNGLVNAQYPVITAHPQDKMVYLEGETLPLAMTVAASNPDGDKGNLSYQWYQNDANNNTTGTAITGATERSYTPIILNLDAGETYFYVEVTNTLKEDNGDGGYKDRTSKSNVAAIEVIAKAKAPVITVHPVSALYFRGQTATPLTVTATSPDGGDITYKWYLKVENSASGSPIDGATEKDYIPSTSVKRLVYYFCEVTNTLPVIEGFQRSTSLKSNSAYIGTDITPLTLEGITGVADKPYNPTNLTATLIGSPRINGVLPGHDVTLVPGVPKFAQADVGTNISIIFDDDWMLIGANAAEYVLLAPILRGNIVKGNGSTIDVAASVTTAKQTSFKIIVNPAVLATQTGQAIEYAISTSNGATAANLTGWKTDTTFTGLNGNTSYYVYARSMANNNYNAGGIRMSREIRTAAGSAIVSAPVLVGVPTDSTITVQEVTISDELTGQIPEYASSKKNNGTGLSAWQESTILGNLDADVDYYIYARSKRNSDFDSGPYIVSAAFKTDPPVIRFNVDGADRDLDPIYMTKSGNKLVLPADYNNISKAGGWVFDWWYTDPAKTIPWDFDAGVDKSMTLYIRWVYQLEINNMKNIREMELIKGGSFMMGMPLNSVPDSSKSYNDFPRHRVTVGGFWMGKYEVTQEKWKSVMGVNNNPSYFNGDSAAGSNPAASDRRPAAGEIQDKRPVEQVSWYEALVFCNKLSMNERLTPAYSIGGKTDPDTWGTPPTADNATWNNVAIVEGSTGYRLPTEAQWEYACRAGTYTDYSTGNAKPSNVPPVPPDGTGWYNLGGSGTTPNNVTGVMPGTAGGKTHQVGLKPSSSSGTPVGNQWGLFDMHGNVAEWCWDWYNTYSSASQVNPTGPLSAAVFNGDNGSGGTANFYSRVFRGGSWGGFVEGTYTNTNIPITGIWNIYNTTNSMVSSARTNRGTFDNSENNIYQSGGSGVSLFIARCYEFGSGSNYATKIPLGVPYRKYNFIGLRVVRPL